MLTAQLCLQHFKLLCRFCTVWQTNAWERAVLRILLRDQLVVSATNYSVKASKELELTHSLKLHQDCNKAKKNPSTPPEIINIYFILWCHQRVSNNLVCVEVCVIFCICIMRYGGEGPSRTCCPWLSILHKDKVIRCWNVHVCTQTLSIFPPSHHHTLFRCLSRRTAITCRQ